MSGIRIISLYSGSSGNSFLISTPWGALLIDAGKSARRLCQAIEEAGVNVDDVKAIFVTHEHGDHVSALPVFLKSHPVPVHISADSAFKLSETPSVAPHLRLHIPTYEVRMDHIHVRSFPTPHDSKSSVGYRIEITGEDGSVFTVGYATDIGYVTKEIQKGLTGCDAVILESNHDPEMLLTGPYPKDLKRRISSRRGHLSNPECAEFAARLCALGTKGLMLAHLSMENNEPTLAYDTCFCAVGDDRIPIVVAQPEQITELLIPEAAI